jgi:hypothetical protein
MGLTENRVCGEFNVARVFRPEDFEVWIAIVGRERADDAKKDQKKESPESLASEEVSYITLPALVL